MTGDGRRAKRVAGRLRAVLTETITRDLADPRLAALVVSSVEVPDDLSTARISVRLLIGDEDERARKAVLASLRGAAGRLRRRLGPALELKKVPELTFVYDTGPDATARVEELLREIEDDKP